MDMPLSSPYSPGLSNFINSLYSSFGQVFNLEPNFPLSDLKPDKRYGLVSFNGLKARDDLILSDRINTRGSYEDRALGFDFLISSTARDAIAAQKEAITLLLSLDHGIPLMKYYVAGEGTSIYDLEPVGDIRVVAGQSEKPPYTWYLDATCTCLAPIEILKDLDGAHKSSPMLVPTTAALVPSIMTSPYIESISEIVTSANQQFAIALSLQPYSRFDLKPERLYGLMHVRSLQTEGKHRATIGHWQHVNFGIELEIHAIADSYKTAQMLAGRMALDLDNAIPAIKPLIEGNSTIYDFQPSSDIKVNCNQSLKPPNPYLITVSCEALMPAVLQKGKMGEHVTS